MGSFAMAGLKFFSPGSFTQPLRVGLSGILFPLSFLLSPGAMAVLPITDAASPAGLMAAAPTPKALTDLLTKIDRAANSRQLPALLENFAPSYTVDGMSRSAWQQQITSLWQRYPNLRYQTIVQSWKPEGNGFSVETLTTITGSQTQSGKTSNITAKLLSRQRIANGKVVQQQILSERVQSTTGNKPPTVEMTMPDKLRAGEEYSIDAIVQEPLNDDVMMGALSEQLVDGSGYAKPTPYKLELLSTGGLFKNTRAPNKAGDYWLSAIFVRSDGMTIITRRIHVSRKA
jgi:hypothetical protein